MDYRKLQHKITTLIDTHSVEISGLNSEIMKLQEHLNEVEHREAEMKRILKEKTILELERRNEILSVKKNLDIVEDKLRKERDVNIKYIDELKSQILLLETEKEDLKGIIAEKQTAIIIMNDRCVHLENELQLIKKENEKFKQDIVSIEEKESELIKKLVVESENKIEQLEHSLNSKVRSLEKDFDDTQENAQAKFQTHINHITHEFSSKIQDYKNQLNTYFTKYEELRKLVDQNEKEYLEQVKEVDERCKILYRELCSIESERDELLVSDLEKKLTMIEIQEKSNCIEKDLKLYKEKCKKYEITLNTMQNTINALGDRLLESENEVIRLNSVEAELESQKKSLEDKSQLLLSDIMALRESMGKMEQEIINDVVIMKEHLAAKVENFKIESAKKVDLLNEDIYNKQCTIDKLLSELDNAMALINELKCSKINYENEISGLKNENRKQLTIIESLNDQMKSSKKIIEDNNQNIEKQQQYIDGLVSDLVLEKERCEALEAERDKVNCKKDREMKELNEKVESMDRSLKNLEEKVTVTDEEKGILEMQLLDAENKILELKMTNEMLSKTKEELESKITELQCTLDAAKEQINSQSKFEIKISCLEAEKSSLCLQMDEARRTILDLENARAEKNLTISKLSEQISIERAKYNDYVSQTEKTFVTLKKHNEVLKINADNGIKLQAAEEKINNLEEELRTLQNKYDKR